MKAWLRTPASYEEKDCLISSSTVFGRIINVVGKEHMSLSFVEYV